MAEQVGLTREHVRRLERESFSRLRAPDTGERPL
nr:hypothetical protein [Streptomyces sp. NRRL S-1022]